MASGETPDRYDLVARALHWLMAATIVALLALGLWDDTIEESFGANVIPLHKSLGMTVFALTAVRLVWRLTRRPPALPAAMPAWERLGARAVHVAFYGLMLGLPVLGYAQSSAGPYPMKWFAAVLPKLPVEKGSLVAELAEAGHVYGGWLMTALVVLHIGAALRHGFILKDGVLSRMTGLGRAQPIA